MSFKLTTEQIRNQTKTVTRRLGWQFLQVGDLIRAVEKCQGLKKGEKMRPLAVLRVEGVRREPLNKITVEDICREGFPGMGHHTFMDFFARSHGLKLYSELVTRIEFSYVQSPGGSR